MEVYKPEHPLKTGDGSLTRLDEVSLQRIPVGEGRDPVQVGTAQAEITWSPLAIPEEIHSFLKSRGAENARPFDLNAQSFSRHIHLRSFLAQSGLDQDPALQRIRYEKGSIIADVEFRFLVDQKLDGKIQFPLERGMSYMRKNGLGLDVANLVLIPEEAIPLTPERIVQAEQEGEMAFQHGRDFSDGLRIPLGPGRYQLGWLCGIDEMEWPAFFNDGKRFMVQLREQQGKLGEFLEPGLNILDMRAYASSRYNMLLGRDVAPGVIQTSSEYLVIDPDIPRILELFVSRAGVATEDTAVPAEIYEVRFNTKTFFSQAEIAADSVRASLTRPVSKPSPEAKNLDELLQVSPDVKEFVSFVDSRAGGLIKGVLIGPKGAYLIPHDPGAKMELWAKTAAKRERPLDERVLERIPEERVKLLTMHNGAMAISELKARGITHHDQFVFVSRILPSPQSMRELAQYSGVGITTFIATELRDVTEADDHTYSSYTIHPRDLGHYRDLVEHGRASIYWLPPDGEFKKLVGPTFVSVGQEEFYKSMELVMALHCSGEEIAAYENSFTGQLEKLVGELDRLGRDAAIVTGGSSELSQRLSRILAGSDHVRSMSIASLHFDQEPDLSPDMIIMSPAGNRRMGNQLLANVSNLRLFLNGGIGTSAALRGALLDTRWGVATPSPIAVVDLQGGEHWDNTRREIEGFTRSDPPTLDPWVPGVLSYAPSLPSFFNGEVMPFIENPLAWMTGNEIPRDIQKAGLLAHIHHNREFGRAPARFLEAALRHFRLV